ncbi:MAG: ATPase [Deltaproteobacteria bacterium RIFCSPLOWO2_12_FULL_40_28]|nr:MAG: ATPase [Deltaproteobacteria bacterium RIFCSPHIGHO2_02_FULL_40_28]OGQ20907.1 MAG: ATPase [Deltaproteobacteria bacterium RIFCSPHIGHO2_12_FULL_40_32]OGQ39308.1 MAG: ATPase [Deltaproteobacteria bacterium RIFCSPLOWO2_02_FULL_40_36]OGQ54589.1 MAG: ATPase [Deltaproteobacteria bacterium RIFCSPLOWO2_12_FULL_40_28]
MKDNSIPTDSHPWVQGKIQEIFQEVSKVIVGQQYLVERLLMGLLADGHILIEGVPGLAKTTSVKTLAEIIDASFQRIQFTPDLLPADILGTQIYNPKTQDFFVKKGPLFHQIILADEINRAPAKVQSALLEAMQEKQITIGDTTYPLPEPFIVLATQNPIEQEGTYPLPEAQVDRFMLKLKIGYPTKSEELMIMERVTKGITDSMKKILDPETILKMRKIIRQTYLDPKINEYIIRIVFATREPKDLRLDLERYLRYGASPRASISLNMVCKAYAFIQGRDYVVPQDVKIMALDVLRHRIILTFEAEAEGLSTDDILKKILDHIEVP